MSNKKQKLKKIRMITKGFRLIAKESWNKGEDKEVRAYVNSMPVGPDTYDLANKLPRKWRVTSFIDCAKDGGVKRYKTQMVAKDVFLNDLTDLYEEIKQETKIDCAGLPVVDSGFYAEIVK